MDCKAVSFDIKELIVAAQQQASPTLHLPTPTPTSTPATVTHAAAGVTPVLYQQSCLVNKELVLCLGACGAMSIMCDGVLLPALFYTAGETLSVAWLMLPPAQDLEMCSPLDTANYST